MGTNLSRSVQFRTAQDVIIAFANREVPNFAIFSDKQFLFRYQGGQQSEAEQLLEQMLGALTGNGSNAIYTVCFYEDLKPGEKITAKTPYDGSFNFRLQEGIMAGVPGNLYPVAPQRELEKQVKELSEAVNNLLLYHRERELADELESEKESEEKEKSIGAVLMQSLEPILPALAAGLVDRLFPPNQGTKTQVAGVRSNVLTEAEINRLIAAGEMMKEKTPDIVEYLEKFAKLSRSNGIVYSMAINQIKNL